MTPSRVVTFILGAALGIVLARTPVVDAVEQALMFGSYNNTAKLIQVTSTGAIKAHLN